MRGGAALRCGWEGVKAGVLPRAGKVKGELPRILAILVITAAKGRLCSVNTGAAGDSPREGQEYPCSQGCESV